MNISMAEERAEKWPVRLDAFCAVTGGLLPLSLVIGNIVFETILSLVCFFWIVRALLIRENPLKGFIRHPFFIPWLAWYGSVLISLGWNGPGGKGWGHDIILIRYFLYVLAMIDISERRPVARYLLLSMAGGMVLGSANILLANAIGRDVFGRSLNRYVFKLKDASRISSLAAYVAPLFIGWAAGDNKLSPRSRILIGATGVIAMAQIFYFHIRTVEVAAPAGILFYFFYQTVKYRNIRNLVLLLGGTSVGLLLFFWFGPGVDLTSIYDRIGYWKVTWVMWKEHPVTGVGVSAWQDVYRQVASSDIVSPFISPDGRSWKAIDVTHSHNLFFHLVSCTGLIGLISFTWLFVQAVRSTLQKWEVWGSALLTWPVVFLMIGITGWNIYGSQYQTLFAIFMALTGSRIENGTDLLFGNYRKCQTGLTTDSHT